MHDSGGVDIFEPSEDLVEEVLDELLFEWSRCEQTVQIGSKQLSDEIAGRSISKLFHCGKKARFHLHVLQWRDEDVAERDDLSSGQQLLGGDHCDELAFSCLRCFNSFNSLYVRLLKTGVEKGFMIFLTATAEPESWSLAELRRRWGVSGSSDRRLVGRSCGERNNVGIALTRPVRKPPFPQAAGRHNA